MSKPSVVLSTTSVYPESSASAFEIAAELGYDGIEVMVGVDSVSTDVDALEKLSRYHSVPVKSVHAPVLLITPNVWGSDPWEKLERSAEAAVRLGADTVVVHPPFRWQGEYGEGFEEGIRRLNETSGVIFAVENMFPWRSVAGKLPMYLPDWDPTERDYEHLTLDLSHAATAQQSSRDLLRAWGGRLRHIHLTDGKGSFKDEHLLPGEGNQGAWEIVRELGRRGFSGHIVVEVSTRRAKSRHERAELLADVLDDTRRHYEEGRRANAQ
ncbi:sugar phosphate isomerase/epimerase [Tessaracoccus sp. OH4464_COT-324]|uniref:sugar phosphate isomerase/epimerase family protein n=1 Tax=Tessaracoccus sp. OH4464_COT-324 TaxID=2491059 RepID=UPI000F6334AD|nr:sugar phosphate isomerase/epimerase family protein [Tessaracoccus sp. OH4464_COT-324]RRD45829.1 sugar phosphate isomerase/epimerase [Tessaracoccus sp. OH4464_COT-324]